MNEASKAFAAETKEAFRRNVMLDMGISKSETLIGIYRRCCGQGTTMLLTPPAGLATILRILCHAGRHARVMQIISIIIIIVNVWRIRKYGNAHSVALCTRQ